MLRLNILVIVLGTIPFINGQANVCDQYLVSGPNGVPDSAFNASSVYHVNDPKHVYGPERGRLNLTETKDSSGNTLIGAWSADKLDVNQYIQVELKDPSLIRGIVTQGRHGCCKQWIKKYRVLYSLDCKNFTAVGDHNSTDAFFKGNSDEDTPETNMFECPVIAKCIRINPIEWNHHISMRFDLMGCSLVTGQATQNAVTTAVPLVPTGGGVQTTSGLSQGAQTSSGGQMTTGNYQITTSSGALTTSAGGSATTGAGLTSAAAGGKANPLTTTSTTPSGKASGPCVKDCQGQPNGDYKSCKGCTVYLTCSNGITYDNRPCPSGLKWDDSIKQCTFAATCP